MIPGCILTIPGLIGFGYAITRGVNVYLVSFLYGVAGCGLILSTIALSSYAIDSFRDTSTEIFVMAIVFKNFFFYGFSNFINNWMASAGPTTVLTILAGISVGLVKHPDL